MKHLTALAFFASAAIGCAQLDVKWSGAYDFKTKSTFAMVATQVGSATHVFGTRFSLPVVALAGVRPLDGAPLGGFGAIVNVPIADQIRGFVGAGARVIQGERPAMVALFGIEIHL